MNRIIDWLIRLAQRKPFEHIDGYMERFWLIPFNRWFLAARIHHILRSDSDRHFHDHPWPFVTILLRGEYTEVRPVWDRDGIELSERRRTYRAGAVLFRRATDWHRLEVPEGQTTWTLFIMGRYQQHWGFLIHPVRKMSWRKYLPDQAQRAKESMERFRNMCFCRCFTEQDQKLCKDKDRCSRAETYGSSSQDGQPK